MYRKARIFLLLFILLVMTLGLYYWQSYPRLQAVSPMNEATDVPSKATMQLTFSRSMQNASVTERLVIEPFRQGKFTWQGNTLVFTPDQPWPAGETVQVWLKAGSKASGLLSLPMRQEVAWSFTIGQPRLVYLYPEKGPADLYILDLQTGRNEPITHAAGGVQDFGVDANDSTVYYSVRNEQEGKGSSIYRLDLGGQRQETTAQNGSPAMPIIMPVPILACPQASCSALAVSPAGDYLAYERIALPGSDQPSYSQVWIAPLPRVDAPGSSVPEDAPTIAGDPAHRTLMPAWSSDGLLVFYDVDAAAFIFFDPKEGERIRFPNQTGQPGAWHPNGRNYVAPEIIFLDANVSTSITDLKSLADSHLLLFNWQTGTTQDLTPGEGIEDAAPAFSPDGKFLAFARKYLDVKRWTPGRQIWLMQTESSEAWPLTNEPLYNHFDFAWSPASDRLVYVRFDQSTMTQPPEIWIIDPSTGQAMQLVKGGYAPQWIP